MELGYSETHFTNEFFIIVQIHLNFNFDFNRILMQWSLQKFAHATTAQLSWHVQNFVVIWLPGMELQQ